MRVFHPPALAAARRAADLTQPQVARLLGVSESTVRRHENGSFPPSARRLSQYAHLYEVDFNALLVEADDIDAVAEYDAQIERVYNSLPPMNDLQRERLAVLLRVGA